MKCLIIWSFVVLLAVCVTAEDTNTSTSTDVHPREEPESVGVETLLISPKQQTATRPCKKIYSTCYNSSDCCSNRCGGNRLTGSYCM